jgi:hypothetical protein
MKVRLVLLVLSLVFLSYLHDSQADVNQSPADANGINSYASVILRSFPEFTALPPKKDFITGVNAHMLLCNVVEKHGMKVMRRDPNSPTYSYFPVKKTDPPAENISVVIPSGNMDSWGSVFDVRFNKGSGSIQIGSFPDPNSAIKIFAEHILHTSMGPNRNTSKELGDISAGWWDERYKGFRRILFIRDNTVVSVSLFLERFLEIGGKAIATMEIAKEIDNALAQGTLGVQRGTVLKVPRIVAIETPPKLISRTQVEAKVRIAVPVNPQDKDSKEDIVIRMIPFHVPSVDAPGNKLTYEVTYITAGCVVTSQQVTLTVTPAAPSGSGVTP